MIFPLACTSSVTRLASRAQSAGLEGFPLILTYRSSWASCLKRRRLSRPVAVSSLRERASRWRTSRMGKNGIDLVFRQRPIPPPELHGNVVEPAGRETAIEMAQSRNDHPHDRNIDIGPRLIEDEEVEALLHGVTPSRLDFSPLPPSMRPMDRNWFSSVNARSKPMRASKCAPDPNSMFSC